MDYTVTYRPPEAQGDAYATQFICAFADGRTIVFTGSVAQGEQSDVGTIVRACFADTLPHLSAVAARLDEMAKRPAVATPAIDLAKVPNTLALTDSLTAARYVDPEPVDVLPSPEPPVRVPPEPEPPILLQPDAAATTVQA